MILFSSITTSVKQDTCQKHCTLGFGGFEGVATDYVSRTIKNGLEQYYSIIVLVSFTL